MLVSLVLEPLLIPILPQFHPLPFMHGFSITPSTTHAGETSAAVAYLFDINCLIVIEIQWLFYPSFRYAPELCERLSVLGMLNSNFIQIKNHNLMNNIILMISDDDEPVSSRFELTDIKILIGRTRHCTCKC